MELEIIFLSAVLAQSGTSEALRVIEQVDQAWLLNATVRQAVQAAKELVAAGRLATLAGLLEWAWTKEQRLWLNGLDLAQAANIDLRRTLGSLNRADFLRRFRNLGTTIQQMPEVAPPEMVREATRLLGEMALQVEPEKLKPVSLVESLQKINDGLALTPPEHSQNVVFTGIKGIDSVVRMTRRSLGIVAAVTSAGKTSMILQMLAESAARGMHCLGISLEMDTDEVHAKTISSMTGAETWSLQTGASFPVLLPKHWDAGSLIFSVCPGSGQSWAPLEAMIREQAQAGRKFDVIAIDYFTLLQPPDTHRSANLAQRYGELSKAMRRLSQELDCCVVLVCQFNRTASEDAEPELRQLRETGQLETDANWALLMSNDTKATHADPDKRLVWCKVAKNRAGQRGASIRLVFDPKRNRFYEVQK